MIYRLSLTESTPIPGDDVVKCHTIESDPEGFEFSDPQAPLAFAPLLSADSEGIPVRTNRLDGDELRGAIDRLNVANWAFANAVAAEEIISILTGIMDRGNAVDVELVSEAGE